MKNPITTYNKILEYRNTLKSLQQLSWEASQIDKRFPLSELPDKDLPKLLESYEELVGRSMRILETLDEYRQKE